MLFNYMASSLEHIIFEILHMFEDKREQLYFE